MIRNILVLFALLAVVAAVVPAVQQYARVMNALELSNQEQARAIQAAKSLLVDANGRGLIDGLLGGIL